MRWFTPHPFENERLKTHPVNVGPLMLGSDFPIRVQSMANTPTHDVERSVNQAIEIIDAGGELVRFTVINQKDAEALNEIKRSLESKGYKTPLVADVHFNPNLADIAARYVDKVRINPGNYLDKRATFSSLEFSEAEYQEELDKLDLRFSKFLELCVSHQTAIRIGTNHGSLSDRIMSRYGDTPEGMVEATMEFLRICQKRNFTSVVVSLKSSNTRVMIFAYRLLALQMQKESMSFALHLGVTEAGSGEDGRIKSAVGIGALLHDGLGDTIRVSLTEHPAKEIPVAQTLVSHISSFQNKKSAPSIAPQYDPYQYHKRLSTPAFDKTLVIADLSNDNEITDETIADLGYHMDTNSGVYCRGDLSPDILYVGEHIMYHSFSTETKLLIDCNYWDNRVNTYPLFALDEYLLTQKRSVIQNWVQISSTQLTEDIIALLKNDPTVVLVCFSYHENYTQELRVLSNYLHHHGITNPFIVKHTYTEFEHASFQLKSAADMGVFFIDGLADGIWLKNTFKSSHSMVINTAFGILQASRIRITKTDYISCPGCGRTLFDLEKTLEEIKQHTQELKGLKIAVMGCIVNGPGEMADADYGYVGAGPGKVALYKGKNRVLDNIDAKEAVEKLLSYIEQDSKK